MKHSVLLSIFLLAAISQVSFATDAEYEGTISREGVRQTIKSALGPIKSCYESALKSEPELKGKVVLEIEIKDDGTVRNSRSVSSTTLKNQKVQDCMMNVVKGLHFPLPPKGTMAVIKYPFFFAPNSNQPVIEK